MKGKFGKRVIAAGLAAVLAVSMCACGKDGSSKGGRMKTAPWQRKMYTGKSL